ncbi:MAG TPA: hypothetical protein PLI59_23385 [Candidatus Obscuribacter sp.]|nr:hypothetical protein [Candidatus Obscuribacter sp.]MBK9280701.1 hypothetical protein [Candidatus Obscuribacter sp.]HNG22154.1 hypothetical protein [Candidatus Obscuribacter sp.]
MSHTPSPVLLAFFTAALISLFLTTYSIRKGLRKEFVQRNYQTAVFFSAIALLMVLAGGKLDNVFIVTAFYAGFSSVALFLLSLRGKLASLAPVYLQGMLLQRRVVHLTAWFFCAGLALAAILNLSPIAALALALTLAWILPVLCIAHIIVDLLSFTCRRYGIY